MERRRFTREFKLEAVRLIKERGVSFAQASHDLSVHQSQLRSWVKALAADPQHAFPGQGRMKPEQLEIARFRRRIGNSNWIPKGMLSGMAFEYDVSRQLKKPWYRANDGAISSARAARRPGAPERGD